jgi:chemotaxis protein CheZ
MQEFIKKLTDGAHHDTADAVAIAQDLKELQEYLSSIRDDLASLSPANVPGIHLPEAKNELGAVVKTTENAANSILDACMIFEEAIKSGSLQGDTRLNGALSTIYEACGFQDLTCQRITKVQRILAFVETKLGALLDRLGIVPDPAGGAPLDDSEEAIERSLMNGPAMPGAGIDQANIDAMFD